MIGLAGKDLEICVEDFLDRHHVPYGVIDSAVFEGVYFCCLPKIL